MANKNPTLSLITPKGPAVYPSLHAPDTKFDANGIYKVGISLSQEEAAPIIEKLTELRDSFRDEAKKLSKGKKVKDADLPYTEDEETGRITINTKMKASGEKDGRRWTQAPTLFDAKGKPLEAGLKVGGGSTIRIAFDASPFWTALVGLGVTLRLKAVQVIELRSWGQKSAEGYGFGEEEGFSAEDVDSSMFTTETDSTKAPEKDAEETPDSDEEDDF